MVYFAARYDDYILGILPVGDVTEVIPPGDTELVVLEEPEHLTWHHHGNQWREQFQRVVRPLLHARAAADCALVALPAPEPLTWQYRSCDSGESSSSNRVSLDQRV